MVNIKQGYKQTDIGVIPEDWGLDSYSSIFSYISTVSNSRSDLNDIDDIGYIHYGDIHTKLNHFINLNRDNIPKISRDKLPSNISFVKNGDLIMADASEDYDGIGKSAEVININDNKIISGIHTVCFRDKNSTFVNGFKGYIHSNRLVKNQLDRYATGLKVFGVSKGNLTKIYIPIPTPKEQEAIAGALSDVDELILSLEKLIAKKQNIKQATMKKLFLTFSNIDSLGSLLSAEKGKQLNKDNMIEYGLYPVYNGGVSLSGKTNFYNTGKNAVIMSEGGNSCGFINFIKENFWAGGHCYVLTSTILEKKYMFYLLKNNEFDVQSLRVGSGLPNIQKKNLYNMNVKFHADINEQKRIVNILSDMDNEIDGLKTRLDKTKMIKQGMMEELLTGKTRLL